MKADTPNPIIRGFALFRDRDGRPLLGPDPKSLPEDLKAAVMPLLTDSERKEFFS